MTFQPLAGRKRLLSRFVSVRTRMAVRSTFIQLASFWEYLTVLRSILLLVGAHLHLHTPPPFVFVNNDTITC